MEENEIRKQMMELWKLNFHDSDEYIKLIFDKYFNLEYVEFEVQDGRIVASLLAIPYSFGNNNYAINSLYLCGLSTHNKYRKRGMMTDLMNRLEDRMEKRGYTFMFLIPASGGLRRYYSDRGFLNGFYRSPLHYTSLHDFGKDYIASIIGADNALFEVKKNYFEGLYTDIIDTGEKLHRDGLLSELIDFVERCESEQKGLALLQSRFQIETFLRESIVSNGRIVICRNREGDLSGIGLYSFRESEIVENGRYAINNASLCKLRDSILRNGGERNLTIYLLGGDSINENNSLWSPMFSMVLPDARGVDAVGTAERVYSPAMNSEVYGMVRMMSISEILKFQAATRKDLKYSILVRLEKTGRIVEFRAKNGHLEEKEYKIDNVKFDYDGEENKNRKILYIKDSRGTYRMIMRERDLGEILFRKPDRDHLVEEAFGLPPINGKISLLLD